MALQEIPLTLRLSDLPTEVKALIDEADRRADVFYDTGLGRRYPNYIPSDPVVVHAAIASLLRDDQLQGRVFCEWGCGFAVASGIAALLGMQAYGLEIEDELVTLGAQLMKDLELSAEIIQADYLPEGFEESEGLGGKDLILPTQSGAGDWDGGATYGDLDPTDIDLFFVYPWPGQEEMMMDLFNAVGADGSILLIYLGDGEIEAHMRIDNDG